MRLVNSTNGDVSVHPNSELSLVVEAKKGLKLDHMLMEKKDSVLVKINESFDLRDDNILKYKDRLCVLDVDDLRSSIIAETYGSRYSMHQGSTKMYHNLKSIYWCDSMKKDNCRLCSQVS